MNRTTVAGHRRFTPRLRFSHCPASLAAAVVAILLTACSPTINERGNLADPELLSQITPGVATRNDILILLGSPSSTATFGDGTWYYIAARTETLAFYEPTVREQQVIAIDFDESGAVTGMRRYGLDDARDIEVVERVTPTSGKKLTILQQLVGNFGRFTDRSAPSSQ